MAKYASETKVGIENSRMEIERIQFELIMPDRKQFHFTPTRQWTRTTSEIEKHWSKACRQRWRALALSIKAKLEAVEAGISCFEDEFMAEVSTCRRLRERRMPPMLPAMLPA